MITLFVTTDKYAAIQSLINNEFRLNELVSVVTVQSKAATVQVGQVISMMPDWQNTQPPILLSDAFFTNDALLGIVYAKLSNYEKAYQLLQKSPLLLQQIDLLNRVQNGIAIQLHDIAGDDALTLHNKAIAMQYGSCVEHYSENDILKVYEEAIQKSINDEQKLFSSFHLAQLHFDLSNFEEADDLLQKIISSQPEKHIEIACKDLQAKIGIKNIVIPYNIPLLNKVKDTLWECLEYYETQHKTIETAMILMDASYIATISNSFSEALGYINKAIAIFENEQLLELSAHAQFTKGNLLQTWGQNDNPQFYRSAVQAYQLALRVFTKEETPDIFAEIQHQLGKVYAEIPDEVKKKSVWASVAVSSFNEALTFFTKNEFPYEYSMICHSFGNAYTKFPMSKKTDNFDKALEWYREALEIRTAEAYPIERVLTLANYLEASWFVGNKTAFDEERYNDMMNVANEIISLTNDEQILKNTHNEIEKLFMLKVELTN